MLVQVLVVSGADMCDERVRGQLAMLLCILGLCDNDETTLSYYVLNTDLLVAPESQIY